MSTDPQPSVVLAGRRRWIALLFIALGVAMIILDATVVNVAIPSMVRDLGMTTNDAEWVNAAYSLTFASLLILAGRVADRSGRRLIYVIGIAGFVIASVLVALSSSAIEVIGSRALQGIGAALILPSSLSVLNAIFTGRSRAIAFAVWGATIGGMAALGPLVGGWLTTYATWHWAFLINVPIGIIVLIGLLVMVPETKDTTGRGGIDIPGTVLVTLGLAGVVFALIEGQRYGWIVQVKEFTVGAAVWPTGTISVVLVSAVIGVIALVLLLPLELRRLRADRVVVLNLRLFRLRSFGAGNAVAMVVSLGEFGLLFSLPLFLQAVRGYDALQTGVILLALALGSFIASGAGAAISQRIGPVRVLQLGMALEVAGILVIGVVISTTVTGWQLVPGLLLYGLGVGFATAQLTGVILSEVPVAESGQASAVQSTARQVGAAIGTAVLGTTLVISLGTQVSKAFTQAGVPAPAAEPLTQAMQSSAGQAIGGFAAQPGGDVLVQAASSGFASATSIVAWMAAGLVFLGLLTSLLLPRNTARVEAEGYEPPKAHVS